MILHFSSSIQLLVQVCCYKLTYLHNLAIRIKFDLFLSYSINIEISHMKAAELLRTRELFTDSLLSEFFDKVLRHFHVSDQASPSHLSFDKNCFYKLKKIDVNCKFIKTHACRTIAKSTKYINESLFRPTWPIKYTCLTYTIQVENGTEDYMDVYYSYELIFPW